jgi:hypothetical protein
MKTPYGFECRFFFGDYYRGRQHEECRLMVKENDIHQWTSKLCATCSVPEILLANACPNLIILAEISATFLGLNKRIKINASCTKTGQAVSEPHIGCGECHTLPPIFFMDNHDKNAAD